jgi:protein O-GlcNAc transferase
MFGRWLKKRDGVIATEAGSVPSSAKSSSSERGHSPEHQLHEGLAHHQAGRVEEAEQAYRQVLAMDAHNFDALHLLGLLLHQTQRSEQGATLVAQATATDGTNAVAWNNLAEIYRSMGRLEEATHCSEKALILQPNYVEAHYNLGVLLDQQGRLDAARKCFERVLALDAEFAPAHNSLGLLYKKLGFLSEAQECYERALRLDPTFADALNNLGAVRAEQGKLDAAVECYREALALRPSLPEAHVNLGNVLREQRQLDEAVASYRSAIALAPSLAYGHYGLGHVLAEQDKSEQALACFETALACDPTLVEARWAHAMTQLRHVYKRNEQPNLCRATFASELRLLAKWFDINGDASGHVAVGSKQPFMLAYQEENNRELFAEYGRLCARLMHAWQDREGINPVPPMLRDRVRVAIVSAHIHDHPVWNAILKGWFLHLDQARFELYVYYLRSRFDDETEFAQNRAAHFESGARGLREWALAILRAQPNVLIYPEIGMDPMTVKLASLRLAPVQVATWGHPETTGLPTIDYYLSAAQMEPPEPQINYTERLVAQPHLGCAYGRLPTLVAAPDLGKLGIIQDCPLLVCAGMPFKYAPEHDWIFPELSRRLERCQLVFFFAATYPEWTQRLRNRLRLAFDQAGMSFDRHVVFIASLPRSEFYGLMTQADVYLDTIGFSGFNTAMQAIECGLPVVTREGRFLRGRLASGILKRMGLADLVVDTETGYVDLVLRLVRDKDYRENVRQRIEQSRDVLYNDVAPIRRLEEFLVGAAKLAG